METASKRRITILVLCAIGFLLIMLIYALGKEAELTGKIQSGYHVVVSANGSRLIHSRRNMTKYSMRFAKERKAKNIMTIMKNSIYSKWAIRQFPLFLSSMYIPTDSWLTLKYKFVDLLIENESKNASKYVIGFIGSAETFGSGTGANQSYPLLIENALSPLFSTVGTKLEVRRAIQPVVKLGEECGTRTVCVRSVFGDDVDLIIWEPSVECVGSASSTEAFLRSAARVPGNPVVVISSPLLPSWRAADCPTFEQPDHNSRSHRPPRSQDESLLLHHSLNSFMHHSYNRTEPFSKLERDLLRMPLHVAVNMTNQIINSMSFLHTSKQIEKENNQEAATRSENLVSYYGNTVAIGVQNVAVVLAAYKCRGPYVSASGIAKGADPKLNPSTGSHQLRADSLLYVLVDIARVALEMVMAAPRRSGVLLEAKEFFSDRDTAVGLIGDAPKGGAKRHWNSSNENRVGSKWAKDTQKKKLPPPLDCPPTASVCGDNC